MHIQTEVINFVYNTVQTILRKSLEKYLQREKGPEETTAYRNTKLGEHACRKYIAVM